MNWRSIQWTLISPLQWRAHYVLVLTCFEDWTYPYMLRCLGILSDENTSGFDMTCNLHLSLHFGVKRTFPGCQWQVKVKSGSTTENERPLGGDSCILGRSNFYLTLFGIKFYKTPLQMLGFSTRKKWSIFLKRFWVTQFFPAHPCADVFWPMVLHVYSYRQYHNNYIYIYMSPCEHIWAKWSKNMPEIHHGNSHRVPYLQVMKIRWRRNFMIRSWWESIPSLGGMETMLQKDVSRWIYPPRWKNFCGSNHHVRGWLGCTITSWAKYLFRCI